MQEKCKNCARPSKACVPFLMTLSTRDMLEWCRFWKEKLGWSNAYLAAKSLVPKGTIDRVMSRANIIDSSEVKLVTVRPIICALTGCTLEELKTCETVRDAEYYALEAENSALAARIAQMSEQLAEAKGIITVYREQSATYRKQIATLTKQVKDSEKKIAVLEKQAR